MSAMLGSKGPVKRVAVLGLGKQEDSALSPAALDALGVEVRGTPPPGPSGIYRSFTAWSMFLRLLMSVL